MEHAYELEEQKYPGGIMKQNMFTITCKYDLSSKVKPWKVLH